MGGYSQGGWDAVPVKVGVTADPAAGAQLATVTVPASKRWKVLGMTFAVVADATVVNRIIICTIGGLRTDATVLLTASASLQYTLVPAPYMGGSSANHINVPFTERELSTGETIAIVLGNLVAGDNIGAMTYRYKEISV